MRIVKIKKLKSGKYKLDFDNGKVLTLYEAILIKYMLLTKKEIDPEIIESIIKDNFNYGMYDDALHYIEIRLRSRDEIKNYLLKKKYDEVLIDETIKKLEANNMIDDIAFAKAYLNDKLNLSNDGPNKIKQGLLSLNVDYNEVEKLIDSIDSDEIERRIKRILDKKLSIKSKYTGNILKLRILNYMIDLGYEKDSVTSYLNNINLKQSNNKVNEDYIKTLKKYSKKYEGYKLKNHVYQKLYSLGYDKDQIESVMDI